MATLIESAGGVAEPVASISEHLVKQRPDALLAVPSWRLEELGLQSVGKRLAVGRHVIALPAGENAMILEFTRFQRGADQNIESFKENGENESGT